MGASKGSVMFVASVYSHLRDFHMPYMSLLNKWGYEVVAGASDDHNMQDKNELGKLGLQCVDIPFDRHPFRMSNVFAYKKLCKFLSSRQDIKLIHVHTPVASYITRIAAASTGFKGALLYTAHGFHFYRSDKKMKGRIYYIIEKYAMKLTKGLVTINDEDYEIAKKLASHAGGQVYFVPGVGIDLTTYYPENGEERKQIRASLSTNPNDVVFICVAELNHNKNHIQFLTAFYKAFHMGDVPAKAWIIGEGPLKADMQSYACKLGIDNNVSFLGRRKDVPKLLRSADVAVLLSQREGLPRFLMEACATGLPIVATDIRGNRDIVSNGHNGILVACGDVMSTASTLHKLASEPHTRKAMGEKGEEKVRMFSLDKVMPMMEEIYAYWLDEF